MEDQKTKHKIAPIRTYAQDLTTAREQRTNPKGPSVVADNKKAVEQKPEVSSLPKETSLPPKVFFRSNKTTPVAAKGSSPQGTLDALVRSELKNTTPKAAVPSAIENSATNFVTENEDAASATIITDTKKDRFKLFPSIFDSFKDWWSEKKRVRARAKTPRYTVAETSRRKGVIQKATSSTGKAASADFASIQERIRKRKLAEAQAPTTPTTTWSANTESGFLLLEAGDDEEVTITPTVQNVVLVPKKSAQTLESRPRTLSRTTVLSTFETPTGPSGFEDPAYLANVVTPKVAPVPEPVIPPLEPISVPTQNAEIVVTDLTPVMVVAEPEEVEDVEEVEEITSAYESATTLPVTAPTNKYLFLRLDTNAFALLVSIIAITILGVGTYLYQTITPIAPIEIFTEEQKIFPESKLVKINLGAFTSTDLVNKLLPLREEVTRVTEVAINLNAVELDPFETLSLITNNLPPDFTHSLTLARPGYSSEQVPFFTLKITDRTIAFGGLLVWEKTMYDDFMSVFDIKITGPASPKFFDASLAGSDVRVLKNTAGEEILIYGIINNTILITTDSLTFAALATVIN